jgi:DNA-binding MarR family transcriptional regulator
MTGRSELDALVDSLYGLSSIRRELQRLAGVEHAVAAITVLSILGKGGPTRVSDIAQDLQVDLSVASRHLRGLEGKGYVDRIPDPDDGRASLIAISTSGREKLDAAHRRVADGLAEVLGGWDPEEMATLSEGLVRLQRTLSADSPESNRSGADGVREATTG